MLTILSYSSLKNRSYSVSIDLSINHRYRIYDIYDNKKTKNAHNLCIKYI